MKIDERIQKAAKKNIAIGTGDYEILAKKMEFSALRDLQDIIASKVD